MVSATEVGGNKTPNSKPDWKKNKVKPAHHAPKFTGSATSDSVLHGKVITSGSNQDGQLLTLATALLMYIAEKFLPIGLKVFGI